MQSTHQKKISEEKEREREIKVPYQTNPETYLNEILEKALESASSLLDKKHPNAAEWIQALANLQDDTQENVQVKIRAALEISKLLSLSNPPNLSHFHTEEKTPRTLPHIDEQEKIRARFLQIDAAIENLAKKNPDAAKNYQELLQNFTGPMLLQTNIMEFLNDVFGQISILMREEKTVPPRVVLDEAAAHFVNWTEEKSLPLTQEQNEELSQMKAERLRDLNELTRQLVSIDPSTAPMEPSSAQDSLATTVSDLKKLDTQISVLELRLIDAKEAREKTLPPEELAQITAELQNKIRKLVNDIGKETREYLNYNLLTQENKNCADESTAAVIRKSSSFLASKTQNPTELRHHELVLKLHLQDMQGLKRMLRFMAEKMLHGSSLIANLTFYTTREETLHRYKKFHDLLLRLYHELPDLNFNKHSTNIFAYSTYTQTVIQLRFFIAELKKGFLIDQSPFSDVSSEKIIEPFSKTEQALQKILRAQELEEEKTATPEALVKKIASLRIQHEKLIMTISEQTNIYLDLIKKTGEVRKTLFLEVEQQMKTVFPKNFNDLRELTQSIENLQKILNIKLIEIKRIYTLNVKMQEAGLLIAKLAIYSPFEEISENYKKLIELLRPGHSTPHPDYFAYKINSFITKLKGALNIAEESACENELPNLTVLPPAPLPPSVAPIELAGDTRRTNSVSPVRRNSVFPLPPAPVTGSTETLAPVADQSQSPRPGSN
ncbi:MAG TPA: hypothetical protein VLI69_00165 [Gammaproteobacteria bacterium]|nr:hypothetical protein [Gammaproteobacteria bacterium]